MALSEAKKAADKRHNAKLDQIMIRPYKEKGMEIRRAAKTRGQSIQAYILEAVQMRMDREAGQSAPHDPSPDPIERRVPLERLGAEVLKLDEEESGREILRLERAISGVELMMLLCNITAAERAEWKRRRILAYSQRNGVPAPEPKNDLPF